MARPNAGADDEAPLLAEEPLRPGACSRELELREFRDRYVIRSLDGGAAFAVARSGGSIRPLSPGQPLSLAAPQPGVSSREASRRALGFVLFWCSARQSASGRGAGGPPNRHLCFCSRAEEAAAGSDCKVSRIYGVAGIIRLLAGESPNFTSHLDHTFFVVVLSAPA